MKVKVALEAIKQEYDSAVIQWDKHISPHDGWAKIYEECTELFEAIRKDQLDVKPMKVEAVQIAAMALRFLVELC